MKKTNKKGFTLIELIVVIAILAILAMILVPSLTGYIGKSKQSVANANARSCYTAGVAAQANVEAKLGGTFAENVAALMDNTDGTCAFYVQGAAGAEVSAEPKAKIIKATWTGDAGVGTYEPLTK